MIYTIRKINFSGKYVEYWFEEEEKYTDVLDDDYKPTGDKELTWSHSSKNYMFEQCIDDAGLREQVIMDGYNSLIGYQLEWKGDPVKFVIEKEEFEYSFKLDKEINSCYDCPIPVYGGCCEYCGVTGSDIDFDDDVDIKVTKLENCPLVRI